MKDVINALFSHSGGGSHRESGLDILFDIMDEQSFDFAEADCGA